jgi:hypothetical protein
MSEQNEIVSPVEIGGEIKNEGYRATNHNSNVPKL